MLWPLRPVDSARVSRVKKGDRRSVVVEHAPLSGVTAEMLAWWHGHIAGTMSYAGQVYPRYQVWHPLDHVSYDVVGNSRVERNRPVQAGSSVRIVEALGRDPDSVLDVQVTVERIDQHSAVIAKRMLGTSVVRMENEFLTSKAGARYVTQLTLGEDTLAGRLMLNRMARERALPPAKLERWIRHHVEEVGNLENFLPELFEARAEAES